MRAAKKARSKVVAVAEIAVDLPELTAGLSDPSTLVVIEPE
jgi:hypothetical protein